MAGKEVFRAETRGKKFEVAVEQDGDKFDMTEYTRGKASGRASGYTEDQMVKRVTKLIKDAKNYDKITYKVVKNDLGVKVAAGTPLSEAVKVLKGKDLKNLSSSDEKKVFTALSKMSEDELRKLIKVYGRKSDNPENNVLHDVAKDVLDEKVHKKAALIAATKEFEDHVASAATAERVAARHIEAHKN